MIILYKTVGSSLSTKPVFGLEKFGGLPNGTLFVRALNWYGQFSNTSANSGSFAPTVFAAAIVADSPGTRFLTNFSF